MLTREKHLVSESQILAEIFNLKNQKTNNKQKTLRHCVNRYLKEEGLGNQNEGVVSRLSI